MAIKQKTNGKYVVDARDSYGKRIRRTFDRLVDAKAFDSGIFSKKYETVLINNGLKQERYSIYKALEEFESTKADLRPKSVSKYRYNISLLRKVFEVFELNFVDEFTSDHGTKLYLEVVREKRSISGSNKGKLARPKPKTVNFFLNTCRAFFQMEVVKNHINRNPMLHIKNQRVEKKRPDYYSESELKAFFSQEMPIEYRYAFLGFLFTGMRFAELANLTWEDVDYKKKLIYVRPKEDFKTKTYNSERSIPMNDVIFNILKEISDSPKSKIFPFCSVNGRQLNEARLLEACKQIAVNAGITSKAYIHKFRSTTASMLVQRGVPIHSVKELLGHSSVVHTEIYAHHKSDLMHPEVATLNNLLQ